MPLQKGMPGELTADGAVGHASLSSQHVGEALDPDTPARRAVAARNPAVTGWMKQTTREVTCWLALCVLQYVGTILFFLYALWELLHLEKRWDVLLPFLVGRGVLGAFLLYLLRMACLNYSRAVSLRASAVFGDGVTLSSAIAAQGGYSRNLVLHSLETTEEIAGRKSRSHDDPQGSAVGRAR